MSTLPEGREAALASLASLLTAELNAERERHAVTETRLRKASAGAAAAKAKAKTQREAFDSAWTSLQTRHAALKDKYKSLVRRVTAARDDQRRPIDDAESASYRTPPLAVAIATAEEEEAERDSPRRVVRRVERTLDDAFEQVNRREAVRPALPSSPIAATPPPVAPAPAPEPSAPASGGQLRGALRYAPAPPPAPAPAPPLLLPPPRRRPPAAGDGGGEAATVVRPIRKRAERETLPAYACEDCARFFAAIGQPGASCSHVQAVGRHRAPAADHDTPQDFWNMDFFGEVKCFEASPGDAAVAERTRERTMAGIALGVCDSFR
jgi:hypothetical protein